MKKRSAQKPSVPITPSLFGSLIKYLFSEYMSRSFVEQLKTFFNIVNTSPYKEDGDIEVYYRVVTRLMSLILKDKIKDSSLIMERVISSPADGEEIKEFLLNLFKDDDSLDVNSSDARFIENEFISRLNFVSIHDPIKIMKKTISSMETNDYFSFDELVDDFRKASSVLTKTIVTKNTSVLALPDVKFNSKDETFKSTLRTVRNFMNDEKRSIKTGIKKLDEFLGGGFQAGRVYLANGVTGGWKSCFLLNVALWACKYNPRVPMFDQRKRPVVVYLTQENDIDETIQRIISYVGGVDKNGKCKDEDTLLKLFKRNKIISGLWELHILYRPKNSITTGDIPAILNEIEAEGDCEVKLLVHDYIKRIKPTEQTGDLRIDLGESANDLSILAKQRKIPVVTANQLNREAYRSLNEAVSKSADGVGKLDQGKKLDPSMISESQLLIENVDHAFGLHREKIKSGEVFITFKKFKDRYSKSSEPAANEYFAHPFVQGNGMLLQEDANEEESLSYRSLEERFGSVLTEKATIVVAEEDEDFMNKSSFNKPKRESLVMA